MKYLKKMESLNCVVCKTPTFLCSCDSAWSDFKGLVNCGKTDLINGVKYSDINISTMTVCFVFNQFVAVQ